MIQINLSNLVLIKLKTKTSTFFGYLINNFICSYSYFSEDVQHTANQLSFFASCVSQIRFRTSKS
jgi:hypothetical protein